MIFCIFVFEQQRIYNSWLGDVIKLYSKLNKNSIYEINYLLIIIFFNRIDELLK